MHALACQRTQGIIHKAVSAHPAEPGETSADKPHREVASLAGSGVSGVQVAVVLDLEGFRRQCRAEPGFDFGGVHSVPGLKSMAAELMQKRSPVGSGPSSKTWPRWLPHWLQRTSTRTMPWARSTTRSTTSLLMGSQ